MRAMVFKGDFFSRFMHRLFYVYLSSMRIGSRNLNGASISLLVTKKSSDSSYNIPSIHGGMFVRQFTISTSQLPVPTGTMQLYSDVYRIVDAI